jgi:hypothetical protein
VLVAFRVFCRADDVEKKGEGNSSTGDAVNSGAVERKFRSFVAKNPEALAGQKSGCPRLSHFQDQGRVPEKHDEP